MIKIINAKNPEVSIHLLPWYVVNDMPRFEIGLRLYDRLQEQPEDTLVLIAVDETTADVKGMLIAENREDSAFMWQAKVKSGCGASKDLFERLTTWAKSKGKTKIVTQTLRVKAAIRLWGFVQQGNNLVKEI